MRYHDTRRRDPADRDGDAVFVAQPRWGDDRLLLVESDRDLRHFLRRAFREDGYDVLEVEWADRIVGQISDGDYDCVVLDEAPPGWDGVAVLRELRARSVAAPILLLTSRGELESRVRSLEAGADDCVVKPFELRDLLARVRALVRRAGGRHREAVLRAGDLTIDRLARRVTRGGRPVDLSGREFALLEFFMRNAGHTVSRSCIAAAVWNRRFESGTNVIDVYVSYLRRKLAGGRQTVAITAVRGVGYRLDAVS